MPITLNGSTGITSPEVTLDNTTADGGQLVLKSSGFDNWNIDNFSGNLRAYYNATEQMRVTSAGLMQFNSGYGSVATAYGCRAWVNFNGAGTISIRGSGNVSSITDNGTGDYTINFTNALADANYAVQIGVNDMSWGGSGVVRTSGDMSTNSVRINTFLGSATTNSLADANPCSVAIFR